jgi:hypothetical protein
MNKPLINQFIGTVRRDNGPVFVKQTSGRIFGVPAHMANFFLNLTKPGTRNSIQICTTRNLLKKFTTQVQFKP